LTSCSVVWFLTAVFQAFELLAYFTYCAMFAISGGRHQAFIPFSDGVRILKISLVAFPSTMASIIFVKCSICLMLLRFKSSTAWRTLLWILMIENILSGITGILLFVFVCRPISAQWNPESRFTNTKCFSTETVLIQNYIVGGTEFFLNAFKNQNANHDKVYSSLRISS
jgi:hypothetical protein